MKRSFSCVVAVSAMICISTGCAGADPVGIPSSPTSPAPSAPPVTTSPAAPNINPSFIYLLEIGTGTTIPLTRGGGPVWSSDGSRIAFYSRRDGDYDLYVMNRDGSGVSQLTNDGVSASPSWSPDGSRIAWISDGTLTVMRLDGSSPTILARSSPGFTKLRMGAWSPDGTRIAFAGGDGTMHVAKVDGSGDVVLSPTGAAAWSVPEPPAWSPDGTQIAFVASAVCNSYTNGTSCAAIFVMSAQGGPAIQLTSGDEDDEYPAWAPDGSRIAFLSYPGGDCPPDWCPGWPNIPALHVVTTDGTSRRQLIIAREMQPPKWSADGRDLLVATADSSVGPGVVAVPASGGAPRQVSYTIGALSPDGRWLAFAKP